MVNLFGVGLSTEKDVTALVDGLLSRSTTPSVNDLTAFFKLLSYEEKDAAERALIARGVSPQSISYARSNANAGERAKWVGYATVAAAAVAGFHGYRRNNSLGWGLAWFTLGSIFPIITNVVAAAQGFAQPRKAA